MIEKTDIPLNCPIKCSGVEVSALHMRDPLVSDILTASKLKGTDAENEVTLFANLCEVEPNAIKSMSLRDYKKLQRAYQDFTC